MEDVLFQSAKRVREAHQVLAQLQLIERWQKFGTPILVGAVAYELAIAPDIDLEIDCDQPLVEDGFTILRDCALEYNIRKARFGNYLKDVDQGLYWRLVYRADDGTDWKIDMWALPRDHPGPRATHLVEPLRNVLTTETRRAILELKVQIRDGKAPHHPSIDIYRAVIDGGVRTNTELEVWLQQHPRDYLTFWKPAAINI